MRRRLWAMAAASSLVVTALLLLVLDQPLWALASTAIGFLAIRKGYF